MTNAEDIVPRELHQQLVWLGSAPESWITPQPAGRPAGDARPRTELLFNPRVLYGHRGSDRPENARIVTTVRRAIAENRLITVCYLDAAARFLADGPKRFHPSVEQWEAMEKVELTIPVSSFASPYPAMAVRIPNEARVRLAKRFGLPLDTFPLSVLVRHRRVEGRGYIFVMSRWGIEENFHVIQDQPGNETIEHGLTRKVDDDAWDEISETLAQDTATADCSQVLGRAALNLCLMLTSYGCRLGGPEMPHEYEKHRRKKHLEHLKHADYLTIHMTQNIVVRLTDRGAQGPVGEGTGVEVKPHWRKGHWRAYPGQAARRAAGENLPLVLVRPCLVRRDRAAGDLSESSADYVGV